jgi:hypothetical protein
MATTVDLTGESTPSNSQNRLQSPHAVGKMVRVVSMPCRIFEIVDHVGDNFLRLRWQFNSKVVGTGHLSDMYVRVDKSKVVVSENMAIVKRQAIAQRCSTKSAPCTVVRKSNFSTLAFSSNIQEYRWKSSARQFWDNLNTDSRLLDNCNSHRQSGLSLLLFCIPGNGSFATQSDLKSGFDPCEFRPPPSVAERFLNMIIGPMSNVLPRIRGQRNRDLSHQLTKIITDLKNNIHTLQVVSVVSVELRWRVEAHSRLWRRVFYEIIRKPFPVTVLNRRNQQYSYKELVMARVYRDPRCCYCNERSSLIHSFTHQIYCPTCFNKNIEQLRLVSLPLTTVDGEQGGISQMSRTLTSPFSGKSYKTYLASDVNQNTLNRSRESKAVEPVQCLELLESPGESLEKFQVDKNSCLILSATVSLGSQGKKFGILHPQQEVVSLRQSQQQAEIQTKAEHQKNIKRLGQSLRKITTSNRKQKEQSKKNALANLKSIGLLVSEGSSVQYQRSARESWEGSIVAWLPNKTKCSDGEYYQVRVGHQLYEVERKRLNVLSVATVIKAKRKRKR